MSLQANRHRLRVARIDPNEPLGISRPKHKGDVGWDLEAMERMHIGHGLAADVPINCRIELPPGFWAEMRARSSIAKRGLQLDAGIIDNGYRGQLFVILRNLNTFKTGMDIQPRERVAQLIFHRLNDEVWMEEVAKVNTTGTSRGEAGFGSTGR